MRPTPFATIVLMTAAALAVAAEDGGPQRRRANAGAPVEGEIRETRVVDGVVYASVTVGADDGVSRRTKLHVFGGRTGRELLGTIEITAVEPEEAVGRVTGPWAAEVREKDRVRSQQERRREEVTEAAAPANDAR